MSREGAGITVPEDVDSAFYALAVKNMYFQTVNTIDYAYGNEAAVD